MKKLSVGFFLVVLLTFGISSLVLADGTEILGTPSIPIASGTGMVAAGTGMEIQPGTIDINVPGTVQQVLLYWSGAMVGDVPGDDTVTVNGTSVTGTLIGGQTNFFWDFFFSTYRADITNLGVVSSGANTLTITDMSYSAPGENNGAGVLVIYDDGSGSADIQLRDGQDLAFINFAPPLDATVPQTFSFTPSAVDRTASLPMFFGSVSHNGFRPNSIEVSVGGITTVYSDLLASYDGAEWDTLNLSIIIPAGADSLTVQAFSRDDNGDGQRPLAASFSWLAAGLSVPPPPPPDGEGCTPGFWRNPKKFHLWPIDPSTPFSLVFNVGPDDPMSDTIKLGGGGEKALIRHGTAAYLNAFSPDVDYFYTPAEVIGIVQEAYATGDFEAAKDTLEEQNGDDTICPLSN